MLQFKFHYIRKCFSPGIRWIIFSRLIEEHHEKHCYLFSIFNITCWKWLKENTLNTLTHSFQSHYSKQTYRTCQSPHPPPPHPPLFLLLLLVPLCPSWWLRTRYWKKYTGTNKLYKLYNHTLFENPQCSVGLSPRVFLDESRLRFKITGCLQNEIAGSYRLGCEKNNWRSSVYKQSAIFGSKLATIVLNFLNITFQESFLSHTPYG